MTETPRVGDRVTVSFEGTVKTISYQRCEVALSDNRTIFTNLTDITAIHPGASIDDARKVAVIVRDAASRIIAEIDGEDE